jgi:hypothetical protein
VWDEIKKGCCRIEWNNQTTLVVFNPEDGSWRQRIPAGAAYGQFQASISSALGCSVARCCCSPRRKKLDQTLMYGCAYVALLSKFDATDIFKKWLLGARNPISVLFSIQDWSCSMVDLME